MRLRQLSLATLLVLPSLVHAQGFVNMEQGPSTVVTKLPVVLVDGQGKETKVDPIKLDPVSGSKLFGTYTWHYVLNGSEADAIVVSPVRILLGKMPVKEVVGGFYVVRAKQKGNSRIWDMKSGSDGFYSSKGATVFKEEEAPTPKRGEDGTYSLELPRALAAGSYLLQTASEIWEFDVR